MFKLHRKSIVNYFMKYAAKYSVLTHPRTAGIKKINLFKSSSSMLKLQSTIYYTEQSSVDLTSQTYGLSGGMLYSVVLLVNSSSYGVMSSYPPVHLSVPGKE